MEKESVPNRTGLIYLSDRGSARTDLYSCPARRNAAVHEVILSQLLESNTRQHEHQEMLNKTPGDARYQPSILQR
jgi:hypothetical protein